MSNLIEKLPLTSKDVNEDRLIALRGLFPEAFREGGLDWPTLQRSLGEWVEPGKERFGLYWPGKADCMRVIQQPSVGALLPMRDESVNFDTTQNLIIEGDNLEVLKLLQKSYYGKVKMIYIDPPYNTGNEFIYPDNFQEGLQEYLRYSGQVDAEGLKLSTNTESAGRYHSKWLSMMYPRLFLAKNLLKDDGVIFISIDDNEVGNLRLLMNEIFGEENFAATFIWEKRTTRENRKIFSFNHDYILCFARSADIFQSVRGMLPLTEEVLARYSNPDNDSRGKWQSISLAAQAGHGTASQFYTITTPSGREVSPPAGSCWRFTAEKLQQLIDDGRIWFGPEGNNVPRLKMFLDDANDGLTPHTLWKAEEVGTTDTAKKELNNLFDGNSVFDTVKPVDLIKRMIQIGTKNNENDIVLDFFAGSGTTSQAVMEANKQDSGNRKFILVQLPERCDVAGYEVISEITIDRARRYVNQQNKALIDTVADLGFRCYRLASSNFKVWDGDAANQNDLPGTLELFANHVEDGRNAEDILYELLLKSGFPLTAQVEKLVLTGKEVFSISDGALLICLDRELTLEVIEAMVEKTPSMILCLDEGFKGNDQLKVNAVQTVKSRNQNDETDIVFRVV